MIHNIVADVMQDIALIFQVSGSMKGALHLELALEFWFISNYSVINSQITPTALVSNIIFSLSFEIIMLFAHQAYVTHT